MQMINVRHFGKISVRRAHETSRNKFHIHVSGRGPIMLMFASGIVGNSEVKLRQQKGVQ